MFPVRCFSCGKVIGNKYELYKFNLESGMSPSDSFKNIRISRYCCKRMFLGHVDIIEKLLEYPNNNNKILLIKKSIND